MATVLEDHVFGIVVADDALQRVHVHFRHLLEFLQVLVVALDLLIKGELCGENVVNRNGGFWVIYFLFDVI